MANANDIICPVCRSILAWTGYTDFKAAQLQKLTCPVCGAPIWLATTFPIPVTYDSLKVIQRNNPVITWDQLKAQNPATAANIETPPSDANLSIYNDFSVIQGLKDSINAVTAPIQQATNIAQTGLIVLGLIALIIFIFFIKNK
jgi:hypothetical protein